MTTTSTPAPSPQADSAPSPARAIPRWLWLAVGALAAFLVRVGHEPLWLDETYSFAMAQHGYADLMRLTTADVHPPLYYLLLKLSTLLLGDSPAALRIPSVLAATSLVALGAGPVRRVWDDRTGWIFAVLALTSSGLLCFAQEARMYALATLLVTGAALYGHLAVRDGRRTDFVALGLFTWSAALTHYFALVAVGVNALILLSAAASLRRHLRPLTITIVGAALGFLPWAPYFWGQVSMVSKGFWIPPTSFYLVVSGLVAPFSYKYEDIPYPWQAIAALLVAVVVVSVTLLIRRFRGTRSEWSAQLQLLAIVLLTLGFGLTFSFLVRPIFMPRYMIVCAGVFLAAVAAGMGRLPGRTAVVGTALLVLLGLPAWVRVQLQTFNGPFAQLAREVATAGQPTPILVHNGIPFSFALLPTSHAVPGSRNIVIVPPGTGYDATGGSLYDPHRIETVESFDSLLSTNERVWIVNGVPGPAPIDDTPFATDERWIQQGEDLHLEEPMSWVQLTVRRYERANINVSNP